MKNIIKLAYVVLCTLVVSCSSFLDEKPQSDFMQEGTGTEDQESKYGSLADAQAELQGAYESFKADIFQSENYTIGDVQSDNCYIGGDGVAEQEFDLLNTLLSNMNQVMTREELLLQVWKYDDAIETNVVDVYIRYLRGKIDVPGKESYIQTVRGMGYVIREK